MDDKISRPPGCLHIGQVSVGASLLGSAMAATIFSMSMIEKEGVQALLLGPPLIFYFGIWIALPVGLIVGIPMLAVSGRLLPRYVIMATSVFALVGLLGGITLQRLDGSNGLGDAPAIFGACIGAMHPLVYARANGTGWRKIVIALLVSAVAVPVTALAGESVEEMRESHRKFEEYCADRYNSMAFVADRARLKPSHAMAGLVQGKWFNHGRSLYARERWIPLDESRVLIARDYAYVPSGFAGWVTGGRRVERHCLSEKRGTTAALLRRYGFGERPTLADLEN
jgi:hypothetical protein